MRKRLNKYSWLYLIHLILNLICIGLLFFYYQSIKVSTILIEVFNIDLAQFLIIFVSVSILIVFFIITLIFFIKSVIQNSENNINKSIKRGIWILPLAFLFFIQLSIAVPAAFTESKDLEQDELCSASKFEELKKEDIELLNDYSYQTNSFGKVVNLEQTAIIPENRSENGEWISDNSLDFNCYYRQSNYKSIYKKFEKFADDSFEQNKIEKDGYTFYFETEKNYISYSLKIENEKEYFVSDFLAIGDNGICNYSQEQFISDSLLNYEKWSSNKTDGDFLA